MADMTVTASTIPVSLFTEVAVSRGDVGRPHNFIDRYTWDRFVSYGWTPPEGVERPSVGPQAWEVQE